MSNTLIRRVLVAGDSSELKELRSNVFEPEHFSLQLVTHGEDIVTLLAGEFFDLIIIEVKLPGIDDLAELCRTYRLTGSSTPIIALTEHYSERELTALLDAGVDDYVALPIKPRELSAIVQAVLRRPRTVEEPIIRIQEVIMNRNDESLYVCGESLHLQPMEMDLLEFLMRHSDCTFSAQVLLSRVWQDQAGSSVESVRTHIKNIRRKLLICGQADFIQTVRTRGYKVPAR